ncbi:DUF4913 domain-containing protein [Nocardia sp. GCM10030253]|uniref:DUF4913 domain-containing protein n=1 Tax=Nocardia sp. GCM10030253 TaxID=3273404 RepID=UPI00362D8CC6
MTTNVAPETATENADALGLGAELADAVRKAVASQVATVSKEIAKAVLADMLTPEVVARMELTAREEAAAALAPAPEPEPEPEPEEKEKELRFGNVEEFVTLYVAPMYRREVTRQGADQSLVWCPLWHEHGEVVGRFTALWLAWEHLRNGDDVEQAQYWVQYFDPMMSEILAPEGPFKYCSVRGGHNKIGALVDLPLEAADEGAFLDERVVDGFVQTASGLVVPSGPASRGRLVVEFPG